MSNPGIASGVTSSATAPSASPASEHLQPIFWKSRAAPASTVTARPGDGAKALLSEIRVCIERLLAHGSTSSIDLRFLKLMPEERARLDDLLGRGEVSAIVESAGRSEVIETAVPCVWWVRHFGSDGEMVGELIEITDIPELLVSDREAAVSALEELCAHMKVPLSQVVAIGDGINDVSMLKNVGLAVAMGNCVDELKSIAHCVTHDVDHSGVAEAIKKYLG